MYLLLYSICSVFDYLNDKTQIILIISESISKACLAEIGKLLKVLKTIFQSGVTPEFAQKPDDADVLKGLFV